MEYFKDNDLPPQTFEEKILSYLQLQELDPEDSSLADKINLALLHKQAQNAVKRVIDDLLWKVDEIAAAKEVYKEETEKHNQYPLFDLRDGFSGLIPDETVLLKCCFHENLVINNLDNNSETFPDNAVGGLCLDIQNVEGRQPKTRQESVDEKIEKKVRDALERIKQNARTVEEKPSILQDRINEYEEFLKEEMRHTDTKYLVHLSSQFQLDGNKAGSKIHALVDKNFHTLEEKRTEYIYIDGQTQTQKTLYYGIKRGKYYIRHTSEPDCIDNRTYYHFSKMQSMIGEGSNFLLMRYIAIVGFKGEFELSTLYINGDICRNIYECSGHFKTKVNKKTVNVCKIYRTIIEKCGIVHNCVTVLTDGGKIVNQEWEGCNYILHINPLLYFSDKTKSFKEYEGISEKWQKDMQLMSNFLQTKEETKMQMSAYMEDHPEINDILADYVQNILLLKPKYIVGYTIEYFSNSDACRADELQPYIEQVTSSLDLDM